MLDKIIEIDQQLLVYLNNLGSAPYDDFWLLITKQLHWTPFFILLAFILYKKMGGKNLAYLLLTVALLMVFTNGITDLVKNHFQRLRPCSDPEIAPLIRIVKSSATYSFFSGHASNSLASMTLIFLILKKYYKYTYLLFLFPLIFAYSRIYLGLHYPVDILCGYLFGGFSGVVFYLGLRKFVLK